MSIISLITATIISLINATGTILALTGGLAVGAASAASASLPRIALVYTYNFLLPALLVLFLLSFAMRSKKDDKNLKFLRLSFGLSALQAITSVIIYQLNVTIITSTQQYELNLLPLIIEVIAIAGCFIGSVICAIKSTGQKPDYEAKPKLFAFVSLGLGAFQFIMNILPVILLKIDNNNSISQSLLQWTTHLAMLQYVTFTLAAINSARKPDKLTAIGWVGALLSFAATIALYTIAYL